MMKEFQSNELTRSANLRDTVYGQIHEHINFIKKIKLNSELSTKEKDEQLKEYKKRIENYAENETKLMVEIESLKNQLSKSESTRIENSQKIDFLFKTFKSLTEQLKELEEHKKKTESICQLFIKDNEIKKQKIEDFWQKVGLIEEEHKIKINDLTEQNKNLKNKLKENCQNYETQVEDLNKKLAEQITEIKSQNKSILDLTNDSLLKRELIDKIQNEKEIISENLQQKIDEIKIKESEWSVKCEGLETKLSEKLCLESNLNEKVADSQNLINNLHQQIDSLKTDLDSKSLEIKNLEEKSKKDMDYISRTKTEEFEAKICVHLENISALELQIEELKLKIDGQNSDLISKDSLIQELNFQVENFKLKLENLENSVSSKQTEIDKFSTEIKFLEEKSRSDIANFSDKIAELKLTITQNEDLVKILERDKTFLIENIDSLKNQEKKLTDQIKAKNDDIENWVTKCFELEKKLESAETNLKLSRGQKRFKMDNSILVNRPSGERRRKIRLDDESIKEIQISMESDLNICERLDESFGSPQTQTIPTYQIPKKTLSKKDDFECLGLVEDQHFLKNYQQCIKESVESYRLKRKSRCLPHLISSNNDPVVTSTPNSPLNKSSDCSDFF
ncbi:hypothetical protein BpHYR1_048250 [Brachionus plicatilis]|uniref:Uncharacterized protein n=1 Tax=Brachionus plicatilis TaxID=10195 RepID=A0A3M7RLL3_BRAPC|nr:hypothetical protein BpHYR1_048250 [Brachionus plicatilis]